jgi:hypothetical protein
MRSISRVLAIATATLAAAVSAQAVEPLTGTYVETVRCKSLYNGQASVESANDSIWYVDDLGDGNVWLHLSGNSGWVYHGWLEVNASKPDQGILGFVACNPSDALPQGEFRVLRVKTAPGKLKVILRGTGLGIRNFGAGICTHKFVRTSDTIPSVTSSCL